MKHGPDHHQPSSACPRRPLTRSGVLPLLPVLLGVMSTWAFLAGPVDAAPAKCFGREVNRVVRADSATVRVGFRDVVWISGRGTTVIGKAFSRICAGKGSQTIRAGKGRSLTDAGPGDDRIILHPSSNRSVVRAGKGDDFVRGSNGHDVILAGPSVSRGDRDRVLGGGGNDRITDLGGVGNELSGGDGSDRIRSLGRSTSTVHGGNGTDFLYSNGANHGDGSGSRVERLFGDRGNDRLLADGPGGTGGAFLDPGVGDDWIEGTDRADTILQSSGVKKIDARGGNDLVVTAGRGGSTVSGGEGRDTISVAAHTPPGYRGIDGVLVDLAEGVLVGSGRSAISGFEDVIGSSFDDRLESRPGVSNGFEGGLGDDYIRGHRGDGDSADGGIGANVCRDVEAETNCNSASPGAPGPSQPVVEIDQSGVLAFLGSGAGDEVSISYDAGSGDYLIRSNPIPIAAGLCDAATGSGRAVRCPAGARNLNGLLAYGGSGDDSIELADSVSSQLTTTINGGPGRNRLVGGRSRDYIASDVAGSAGTTIQGRGGNDLLYVRDDVFASGGGGSDLLHVADPCVGAVISGGADKDNLVLAAAAKGVRADFGKGYAEWVDGGCPGERVSIAHDVEDLEGSRHDDVLVLGPRFRTQDGPGGLLGRDGIDVLDSRNGVRDTVTVGSGGRENVVRADRSDRVEWGWGLARG